MPVSRPSQDAGGLPAKGPAVRCVLAEKCPTLFEFLTEAQYDDGTARTLPSLTLFAEPGCLKAALNDRDVERVAFVTAGSLTGLLEALEEGLVFGTLDWRPASKSRSRRN